MTRIAVTGHYDFPPETAALLADALRAELAGEESDQLLGLTCLAHAADQAFARAILEAGGMIEVFVPAVRYPDSLPDALRLGFQELVGRAVAVHRHRHEYTTATAHSNSSRRMLGSAERLIAIWDGDENGPPGCTAEVVALARRLGVSVTMIWPKSAARSLGSGGTKTD